MAEVIVITGANSGIGKEIALTLAGPGRHFFLLARRVPELEKVATALRETGAQATVRPIDLRREHAWPGFFDELAAQDIRIDQVYHCAVRMSVGAVHNTTAGDWEEIYRVNLLTAADILATVFPEMIARSTGRVVLFGSISVNSGYPMATPYCATKTAIHAAWRSLLPEAKRSGVGLHYVSPGFVDTPLFENFILRGVTRQQTRQCALSLRVPISSPRRVATTIVRKIERGKTFVVTPNSIRLLIFIFRHIPSTSRRYFGQMFRSLGVEK